MTDTTSAAPSLLPCPFCGAAASGYAIEAHTHSAPLKSIGIPDHPGSYVIEGDCQCGSGLIGETQQEVTARWNRRAQPTPPAVVEPLTVQQIWASDEIMSANAMPMDDLLRIVRAVEAAHGIGVKKGESNGLPT